MQATGLALPNRPQQVNVGGILSMKPLSTVLQEEAARASVEQPTRNTTLITSLAGHIHHHWTLAKMAKLQPEKEMLAAVRARRGEYDPEKLADIRSQGGSEIYMMVFATKARQLKALLTDIMVGTGNDKPWTFRPTPKPELPPSDVQQVMQAVYQETTEAEMAGVPFTVEEVRQKLADAKQAIEERVLETARREAERAELVVEDAMVEGRYLDALDAFIDDLTTFKTAFIKGPVVRRVNDLKWVPQPDGSYAAQVTEVLRSTWERADPFMMYPAPWARDVNDAYLIERHRLSRSDLNEMIGVDGYDDEAIRAVLREHGEGGLHEWLMIDTAKATAEGRNTVAVAQNDLIDALQYWGSVSGQMLLDWGLKEVEIPDPTREYEVEAWLIGSHVIKAVLNPDPLRRRPYYADGFSRTPGAFWHNSLYDVVRDYEDMCNAAARALSNNMGIASGPQAGVNIDRMPQGEDLTSMYPWKLWQFTSDPTGSSAAPIVFFQPDSHANELMGIYERFSLLADEAAGLPKYLSGMTGGEGGAGRTASGLSMMVTNASKTVKQTLASIDLRVIGPMVERQYQHELMYSPDKALTGDVKVVARGALSLIAKEAAQVRLNEFLAATANPIDMQIVGLDGRAELLRQAVKRLDINGDRVVPSATTVKLRAAQAQMQQMAQQPPQAQGSGQNLMDGSPTVDAFQPTGA